MTDKDELLRALSRPPRNEPEARRFATAVKLLAGDGGPATMKPVAVYEPEWTIEVAARLAGQGGDDWRWVSGAELIAAFRPELLLAMLTAMRPIAIDKKRVALDRVGESLAVAGVERPTLAECRAAIDHADEAPRRRRVSITRHESPPDVDRFMFAFIVDALGCEASSLPDKPPTTSSRPGWPAESTRSHRVKSSTCTVVLDRTESYWPGDVNEPERTTERVSVAGERHVGSRLKVTLETIVGDRDMWIDLDGSADERDRILAKLWRALGIPRTAWDD